MIQFKRKGVVLHLSSSSMMSPNRVGRGLDSLTGIADNFSFYHILHNDEILFETLGADGWV